MALNNNFECGMNLVKTIRHNILVITVLILVVCFIILMNIDFPSNKIVKAHLGFFFVLLLIVMSRKIKTKRNYQ